MADQQRPYSNTRRADGSAYQVKSHSAPGNTQQQVDRPKRRRNNTKDDITVNDDIQVINDEGPRTKARHASERRFGLPRLALPNPRSPRGIGLLAIGVTVTLILATVGGFLVSGASAAEVRRAVTLAGENIGGQNQDQLRATVTRLASSFGVSQINVQSPEGSFSATANEMGMSVDIDATVASLMDQYSEPSGLSRYRQWIGSFFGETTAKFVVNGDSAKVRSIIDARDPGPKQPPADPAVEVSGSQLRLIPAGAGRGIDPVGLTDQITAAAATGLPVTLTATRTDVVPRFSNEQAAALVDLANARIARGVTLQAGGASATINASTLREWVRLVPAADGTTQQLALDGQLAQPAIETALVGVNTAPTDASLSVTSSGVVVTPGAPGRQCCGDNAVTVLSDALFGQNAGTTPVSVVMPTIDVPPTVSAEELQGLGIKEAVATFTTRHPAGQPRVKNIHKVADITRGKIIKPGESLSFNQLLGERTLAKGYVVAPVIAEGRFSESPGGGISQFATTMFNAAFFAGLELQKYQSHSIYISRYPYGREATLSWPSPDLQIGNPSPYGVLIWPTYTESSITVTLYSTKWVNVTQTGQTKSTSGSCTVVRTTRSRVKVDGSGALPEDSIRATYRAQEGLNCGDPIPTTTLPTTTLPTTTLNPTTTTAPPTTTTVPPPATP